MSGEPKSQIFFTVTSLHSALLSALLSPMSQSQSQTSKSKFSYFHLCCELSLGTANRTTCILQEPLDFVYTMCYVIQHSKSLFISGAKAWWTSSSSELISDTAGYTKLLVSLLDIGSPLHSMAGLYIMSFFLDKVYYIIQ